MSDSSVLVTTLSTGTAIDNSLVTTGAGPVQRQRTSVFDPVSNQGAAVDANGRLAVATPNITSTQTNPTVTTASSTVLASNASAKYRFIQNTSATAAWLSIGGTASLNTGMYIGPYGSYEMSGGSGNLDNRAINAISTSGSILFAVLEGV